MSIVRRLVQGTDFRRFLDFATPAFFEVMPARGLLSAAGSLVKGYRDRDGYRAAVEHRAAQLPALRLTLSEERPARPVRELDDGERRQVGEAALRLYFHQLLDPSGATLLNLGADRFGFDGGPLYRPGPGFVQWPPAFQGALADVYRSFYLDTGKSLDEALEPLGLVPAADVFERHFGDGEQRAVKFRVSHFIAAFHEVFLVCKREKIRLDPAFLSLGIYLATLYETLEEVGVPLDVRASFEAAADQSRPA